MAMFWREQSFTQQQIVMRDFSHGGKLQSLAPKRTPAREERQAGERGSPLRCHRTTEPTLGSDPRHLDGAHLELNYRGDILDKVFLDTVILGHSSE